MTWGRRRLGAWRGTGRPHLASTHIPGPKAHAPTRSQGTNAQFAKVFTRTAIEPLGLPRFLARRAPAGEAASGLKPRHSNCLACRSEAKIAFSCIRVYIMRDADLGTKVAGGLSR